MWRTNLDGSQVLGMVHPLMQDADDVDAVSTGDIEDHMTAERVAPKSFSNLAPGTTSVRIHRDAFDRRLDLEDVLLRLTGVPALLCKVPVRREIRLRGWREPVLPQGVFEATKVSKSKGSALPLVSPTASAARSADR